MGSGVRVQALVSEKASIVTGEEANNMAQKLEGG